MEAVVGKCHGRKRKENVDNILINKIFVWFRVNTLYYLIAEINSFLLRN